MGAGCRRFNSSRSYQIKKGESDRMERELLFSITKKDFRIEFFSGTGKGGQYRNKHQNCVRLHHSDSGVLVTGQSYRERRANIKEAFNNFLKHPKFKIWHSRKVYEALTGKRIEDRVEEMMSPENIQVEIKEGDVWIQQPIALV